ncbi:unnamed protein product, partial [Musa acuminata subsp. burmannicoides]
DLKPKGGFFPRKSGEKQSKACDREAKGLTFPFSFASRSLFCYCFSRTYWEWSLFRSLKATEWLRFLSLKCLIK